MVFIQDKRKVPCDYQGQHAHGWWFHRATLSDRDHVESIRGRVTSYRLLLGVGDGGDKYDRIRAGLR